MADDLSFLAGLERVPHNTRDELLARTLEEGKPKEVWYRRGELFDLQRLESFARKRNMKTRDWQSTAAEICEAGWSWRHTEIARGGRTLHAAQAWRLEEEYHLVIAEVIDTAFRELDHSIRMARVQKNTLPISRAWWKGQ